jgi:hypothetical protein
MASSIKLSTNDPNVHYQLQMKLVKVTKGDFNNCSGQRRESIYCHKKIVLSHVHEEASEMVSRLMSKVYEAAVKT